MKKLPSKLNKKELLKLPVRKWGTETIYDHVLVVPTGRKHDSGFMLLAIVGVIKNKAEIAAYCDDIGWNFSKIHPYDRINIDYHYNVIRTDCYYPSGILRMWASGESKWRGKLKVGRALSSTEITLVIEKI